MPEPAANPVIAELRSRIERLEGGHRRQRHVLPFGSPALDSKLPGGGLALGCLHEVTGGGNGALDGAAAALFAAGIAARTRGKILWLVTRRDLFMPAIAQAGLHPDRMLHLEAGDEKSLLACFEEGLRHGGLGAVIAETARLSMTASRRLQLAAVIVEPLRETQPMVTLIDAANPDISDLVDVLANRIGESRLCRFTPVESDVPERSVAMIAALSPETGATWNANWPRPTRLLTRPEPIETMALLPDNPPVWFTWRGVRRRVRQADGPERIRGEWWKRDAEMATVRDYFQVEDDAGERYWIFRSGDGEHSESGSQRWFLHGVFG